MNQTLDNNSARLKYFDGIYIYIYNIDRRLQSFNHGVLHAPRTVKLRSFSINNLETSESIA